jgi:predicted Fe-Mo cluster-binding NifX family protein
MSLCIPTADDRGLDASISPHFGGSAYLTLVGPDGSIKVLPNPPAPHVHGSCGAGDLLGALGVHAVICQGVGRNALTRLRDAGVSVFVTDCRDVKGALEAHRDGRLAPLTLKSACHGGRHEGAACRTRPRETGP